VHGFSESNKDEDESKPDQNRYCEVLMEMISYLQHGSDPEASCMSIDSNCGGKRVCASFVPQPDMISNVYQISYWYKHHIKII